MDRIALTAWQRQELHTALAQAHATRFSRRLAAVLTVAQGRTVAEVADSLGVSRQSIYGWLQAYQAGGVAALMEQPHPGRPSGWAETMHTLLQEMLNTTPQAYGYPATTWTIPLLAEQLRQQTDWLMTDKTLRRELHALGYSWKRSRYVLAPDPQREKKKTHYSAFASLGPTRGNLGARRE